ncbi:hypothetical protein B566_EDAN013072, partial [Ephemera danica]
MPLHELFSREELLAALSGLTDSAPGEDNISFSMIQHLPDNVSSYRPIALLSCVAKIFEKLVKLRLEIIAESKKLIPPEFTGFRKGHSTLDSLATLSIDIQVNLAKKKTSILELFDIQGAFDNVNLPILFNKLLKMGFPRSICNVLFTYLSQRQFQTRIGNKSSSRRTRFFGLPQGSILSLLLFILFTTDLTNYIPANCYFTMFADDLTLMIFASNISDCIRYAEQANYSISKWLRASGLTINPSKSEFMIFSSSRLKRNYNSIKFENKEIKRVQQHRLLGIIIDDKLSWKPHFNYLTNTCRKCINILKATCHRWWGANPNIAIILYKSLIRSRLEYGSPIYGNASKAQWQRLERIQNSAIRTILGAFPSAPIPALLLESGIPPLMVRSKYSSNKYILKIASQQLHPLNLKLQLLNQYIQRTPSSYWNSHPPPLLLQSWQLIHQWTHLIYSSDILPIYKLPVQVLVSKPQIFFVDATKLDRENPLLLKQHSLLTCELLTRGKIKIYTDGSKSHTSTGCSIYNSSSGYHKGFKLPNEASIFTAEASAINMALKHIITEPDSDYAILSDSKSVLQALLNTSPGANYNWILTQIRTKISILSVFHKSVIFIWIPAHCGIIGNEFADLYAKNAASDGQLLNIPLPHSDFTTFILTQQTLDWEQHWEASWNEIDQNRINPAEPSWYHTLVPSFPRNPYKPWFSKTKINRSIIFTITRLRIGHWAFPYLLHRLRMIQSNRCDCGSVGTINHIFFSCPDNEEATAQLILSLINFNIDPLLAALSGLTDSAPGEDNISFSMIQHLPDNGLDILRDILNHIWTTGSFPDTWKISTIIPILKKNKPANEVSSYRPIALLSCVAKIFEKLVKLRLEIIAESKKLIPPQFTGFRKGHSTLDSLATLSIDIQVNLAKKKTSILELFDIQGAFDNVNLPILFNKLLKMGFPRSICNVLFTYLSQRQFQTRIGNKSSSRRTRFFGLPQGSILSLLLFILFTTDLTNYIPANCYFTMFADDLTLMIFASNISDCIRYAEQANYSISKWLRASGLTINPSKSEFMIFSSSRLKRNYNSIKFENKEIKRVQQHRLLGIIIDDKLSWKPHFNYLTNTCRKCINILKATCHRWWGANPNIAIILYKSLIRSRLEYGSPIYGNASKAQWQRLERIQNSAIRTILGAFPSAPIPALLLESGIPPLMVRSKYSSNKYILKIASQQLHPLNLKLQLLNQYIQRTPSSYWNSHPPPLLLQSWQLIHQWTHLIYSSDILPIYKLPVQVLVSKPQIFFVDATKLDRENPLLLKQHSLLTCELLTRGKIKIYTDGSKSHTSTGCSIYNSSSGYHKGFKLPNEASIFTAEASAINMALKHIITEPDSDYAILSDSKSVLQALLNTSPGANYNWILTQIRTKISILSVFHKSVIFIWIPAHCGIIGNEFADLYAKNAASDGQLLNIPLPHSDFTTFILTQQTLDWEQHWEASWNEIDQNRINPAEPSWYHTLVPSFPRNPYKPWFSKTKINRSIIFTITRLRIGHWAFPYLLHRLRMIQSNRCDCGSVGTINHIFFSCPDNEEATAQLILSLINFNIDP